MEFLFSFSRDAERATFLLAALWPIRKLRHKERLMYPSISLSALLSRLSHMPGNVEELLASLASKPREWWTQYFTYPLVNVREVREAFHIEAEVPGATQDRIEIFLRYGTELTIQGVRKPVGDENDTWHYRERGEGRFQRVLTLPAPVDAEKAQARLERGVLCLLLPKAESVQSHRIPVQETNEETTENKLS
jgi:HSP20 family protein